MNISLADFEGFYISTPCSNPECDHFIDIEAIIDEYDTHEHVNDIQLSLYDDSTDGMIIYVLIDVTCPACGEWTEKEFMPGTNQGSPEHELDQFDIITKDQSDS